MLTVAWEHGINWTDDTLYPIRRKDIISLAPHALDEIRIGFSKFSLSSQEVCTINLVLKKAIEEVLCEWKSVWKALQTTVHKASIAQISQSN